MDTPDILRLPPLDSKNDQDSTPDALPSLGARRCLFRRALASRSRAYAFPVRNVSANSLGSPAFATAAHAASMS